MKSVFKSETTEKVFFAWVNLVNYHLEDEKRFYEFARHYYNAGEEVSKVFLPR